MQLTTHSIHLGAYHRIHLDIHPSAISRQPWLLDIFWLLQCLFGFIQCPIAQIDFFLWVACLAGWPSPQTSTARTADVKRVLILASSFNLFCALSKNPMRSPLSLSQTRSLQTEPISMDSAFTKIRALVLREANQCISNFKAIIIHYTLQLEWQLMQHSAFIHDTSRSMCENNYARQLNTGVSSAWIQPTPYIHFLVEEKKQNK